ncbi:MAG: tetratricopeptide repeat protein [Planctomycetota bacterium]|nr:tetratricopeptide repeat protein [Planctomycetota bacterium]
MISDTSASIRSFARFLLIASAVGTLPCAVAAAGVPTGPGSEAPPPSMKISRPDLAVIWNDPGFQKSFIGGYGVSADIEPRIAQDDMALLELVRQLMAEELPAAESLLRESVRPDVSAVIDLTLGGVQFQQDKIDDALVNYRNAVAKFPNFRRAYRSIGLICTRKSQYEGAIAAFNKMIELGGADAYSYGLLGFCHSARGDYQPSEAAYRNALLLQPDNVEWRLGLTRAVFKQAKYEDAASLLDVLITNFPDKADFWLLQAHTYLGLKQPMKAAVNLEALDSIGKSTVDSLFTLGDIYVSETLPDMALSAYDRAITKNPTQPVSRSVRAAEVLAARGGLLQSKALLTRVKANWSDTLSDADRRKVLKLQARLAMSSGAGDAETATVLEEVIALDPLDGEALMLLGQHYNRIAQPDKAILYYERAARIDSFAANAKVKIAQVFVAQGRFTEALPLLRDAQSLKPRDDIARYIEQVERASKSKR